MDISGLKRHSRLRSILKNHVPFAVGRLYQSGINFCLLQKPERNVQELQKFSNSSTDHPFSRQYRNVIRIRAWRGFWFSFPSSGPISWERFGCKQAFKGLLNRRGAVRRRFAVLTNANTILDNIAFDKMALKTRRPMMGCPRLLDWPLIQLNAITCSPRFRVFQQTKR